MAGLSNLPVELQLIIFEYAVQDSPIITIGIAQLVGRQHDIIHRLYGEGRLPYPEVPSNHEPVVRRGYDAGLLSNLCPATIDVSLEAPEPFTSQRELTAYASLLRVNKQIHSRIKHHFSNQHRRQTSLFVQFPLGPQILRKHFSYLLHQARSVHLAGTYSPHNLPYCHGAIQDTHLGPLVESFFGPSPRHTLDKFEMRIYFPGSDSYSHVWSEDSPISVFLRHTCHVEVRLEVWRGDCGTGVYVTAKQTTDRGRVVSTVWRKLQEGRSSQPKHGSWLMDNAWPEWHTDLEVISQAEGTIVTMTPRDPAQSI